MNHRQKAPEIHWISSDEDEGEKDSSDNNFDNSESVITADVLFYSRNIDEGLTEKLRGMSCKFLRLFNVCILTSSI